MKKFAFRTIIFLVLASTPAMIIFNMADGRSDGYYLRFTTPEQNGLILGSSRAAQGMQPACMDSAIQTKSPGVKMFNYAFTSIFSPYGPAYYKSVEKKLDKSTRNGVFILTVDGWLISSMLPEDETPELREGRYCVARTPFVNMKPNIAYLLRSYDFPFWQILKTRFSPQGAAGLHNDGWLQVNVTMAQDTVDARIKRKLKEYNNYAVTSQIQPIRIEFLKKTIQLLKEHGSVYLVRLPVSDKIRELEAVTFPEFDNIIHGVSNELNVPYVDLYSKGDTLRFTDGDHLEQSCGCQVSARLGKIIAGKMD